MDKVLKLLRDFENRNDKHLVIIFCSDGSSVVEEYSSGKILNESNTPEELYKFLINTNFKPKNYDPNEFKRD